MKNWRVTWQHPHFIEVSITYREAETEEEARKQVEDKIVRHKGKIIKVEKL